MTDQNQHVGKGAVAVQSARDTYIGVGVSASDVKTILQELGSQIGTYTQLAREIVDARLADFESRLLIKLLQSDKSALAAFIDPDFQYLVGIGQRAHSRFGDPELRDTLIDLISMRSVTSVRGRMSLTLGRAIEIASSLTKNEFDELSLAFLMNFPNENFRTQNTLVKYFNIFFDNLIDNISSDESSYDHLEAVGCAFARDHSEKRDNSRKTSHFIGRITTLYPGLFHYHFSIEALYYHLNPTATVLTPEDLLPLITKSPEDPFRYRIAAATFRQFSEMASGLPHEEMQKIWKFVCNYRWDDKTFIARVERAYPNITRLIDVWDDNPVRSLHLTTLGIALGYINTVRIGDIGVDLSVFIR